MRVRLPSVILVRLFVWSSAAGIVASCAEAEPPSDAAPPTVTAGQGGDESGNGGAGGDSAGTTAGKGGSPNIGGEGGDGGEGPEPNLGGAAGGGPECVSAVDCDDANACTTDSCNVGKCYHIAKQGTCDDDQDACTTDVCVGGQCTHPDNGTCPCTIPEDCNDNDPCTDEACTSNTCVYTDNPEMKPCASDGNDCTEDVCAAGICTHEASETCSCEINIDCNDFNPCTDDICGVDKVCTNDANTAPCSFDDNPCTDDQCELEACGNPDKGICTSSNSNLLVIRAIRTSRYVVLNGDFLEHSGQTMGGAEVFETVEEAGNKFKLRALSSGDFVTLGANDHLEATADQAGGTRFNAPPCGAYRGLQAQGDDDASGWVLARDPVTVDSRVAATAGSCGGSWEQFELIPIGGKCADALECDDANDCTTETCTGGFCVFTELTSACTDEPDACTDNVCGGGNCTHPQNGTCTGTTIKIRSNRNDGAQYVVLNAMFLEHTGADFAAGAEFEQVTTVGDEFRLRASVGAQFVRVDATENLIADTDFAGAAIFSNPDCAPLDAIVVESGDNDNNVYLKAEDNNRVMATNGSCNPASGGSYEKWELVPSP